jgi:hypothetical protein
MLNSKGWLSLGLVQQAEDHFRSANLKPIGVVMRPHRVPLARQAVAHHTFLSDQGNCAKLKRQGGSAAHAAWCFVMPSRLGERSVIHLWTFAAR